MSVQFDKMMVNQLNNNATPWPSTIPQQMPWMNSYQASSTQMQFGQSCNNEILTTTSPSQEKSPNQQHTSIKTLAAPGISASTSYLATNPFSLSPQSRKGCDTFLVQTQDSPVQSTSTTSNTSLLSVNSSDQFIGFDSTSLTHIPVVQRSNSSSQMGVTTVQPQKRSSVEIEDEQLREEEPPTKQQLSESKLVCRFGSLQLDVAKTDIKDDDEDIIDDECIDVDVDLTGSDDKPSTSSADSSGRRELNRYVYLLFKDKKTANQLCQNNNAVERLIREEREKLSKAVILWNPPPNSNYFNNDCDGDDDDSDEELSFRDHRDFLKTPNRSSQEDSIVITEVFDNPEATQQSNTPQTNDDDVMFVVE